MTVQKIRLGELLVTAGVLTEDRLGEALELQKSSGQRLGSVLIQAGFVTEPQLIQALSKQLSIPWVSLWHLDISEQLLDMIPEDVVVESGILPIYIRSMRDGGKALYVAMDNPSDTDLLDTISQSCGMAVRPMIAGPSEIASAIHNYYGRHWRGAPLHAEARTSAPTAPASAGKTSAPEEEELLLEDEVTDEEPAGEASSPEVEGTPPEQAGETAADDRLEPLSPAPAPAADLFAPREEAPARKGGRRFKSWRPAKMNLTFLDGTSVALGPGKEQAARSERSTEEILDHIGALGLEGGQGTKLALAVKGILGILLRRGMLTDAELRELIDDD